MIVHRRTWLYRQAGEKYARVVTFKIPVTARLVREKLNKIVGSAAVEIWAR